MDFLVKMEPLDDEVAASDLTKHWEPLDAAGSSELVNRTHSRAHIGVDLAVVSFYGPLMLRLLTNQQHSALSSLMMMAFFPRASCPPWRCLGSIVPLGLFLDGPPRGVPIPILAALCLQISVTGLPDCAGNRLARSPQQDRPLLRIPKDLALSLPVSSLEVWSFLLT